MATAGGGRARYESGRAGEKFCKIPFRPDFNEEHQNVSQEVELNNSSGVSDQGGNFAAIGVSELEQMLKQMTFTRSEAQRLIVLVHSRTIEESPSPLQRLEASTSGSLKKHKHGYVEEQIASPVELSKTPITSPQQPATMENLPNELLINIFIRLLAKQLAQMRSVSKSWNALLSQSSFIESHLHRSIHNNDQILMFIYHNLYPFDSKQFTARLSQSPHLEPTNFNNLTPVNPKSQYTTTIDVIGSVNGLICSSYGDSVIHIWNPSLSAMLTLPPSSTPSPGYDSIRTYFRFGFDPKTEDYKVFKLVELLTNDDDWWLPVEIYSMRKGSWEFISKRFPSHITSISNDDLVCRDGHDGRIHWLGYTNKKIDSERIVAFDFSSESFREIPLPHSTVDFEYGRSNALGVLAGKLCVVSRVGDGTCEVWVMEEYGVVESWVKHHVFSRFIGDTWPLAFTSNNEFLLDDKGRLVLYDSVAKKTRIFENFCPGDDGAAKIVEYVDSLVWIAPARP